jgi:hypothetical protein
MGAAMTEHEWLHGNCLRDMLDFVEERATPRELRLFACACCRRIWHLFSKDRGRRAVQVAEGFANGEASGRELAAAHRAAAPQAVPFMAGDPAAFAASSPDARYAAHSSAYDACQAPGDPAARTAERQAQLALARCVFGNPFCPAPAVEPRWLAWDGGRVTQIAHHITDGRHFEDMPILADALEDAGCADEGLLAHCRSAEHALGCWVLDLLLTASPREDELVPEAALDYQEILRRGGANYGDEGFALFKCPRCGRVYLFEDEVETAYLDPADLSRRADLVNASFTCPGCGHAFPDTAWVGPNAGDEFKVTWRLLQASGWSWVARRPFRRRGR